MAQFALTNIRNFKAHICGECGIEYWVPERWDDDKRQRGESFWCPNGHCRVYRETEATKLRRELEAKQREVDWHRQLREKAEKDRRKVERKLSRVQKGVCPECKRSFENLRRHMESQHQTQGAASA